MAATIRLTTINEGNKYATLQYYLESDGSGELVDFPVFDPTTDFLVPIPVQVDENGRNLPPEFTIRKVWFGTAWFDIILGFEGAPSSRDIVLARDAHFHLDFTSFGGIKNRIPVEGYPTGRMTFTTRDFATAGAAGFIVLEIKKD